MPKFARAASRTAAADHILSSVFAPRLRWLGAVAPAAALLLPAAAQQQGEAMDQLWGEQTAVMPASERTAFFDQGNYGMFVHFGFYSQLANRWNGETFYGIGEWILREKEIPVADYMAAAAEFNPAQFDAKKLVDLAQAAGMRWIILTSKHHDGFAMFDSDHPFNIVDSTPFKRDVVGELAAACAEANMPFGVYYSHFQDWTAPGGSRGPQQDAQGNPVSFDDYFQQKCLPQIDELCTRYGPLQFFWFDTPGSMSEAQVKQIVDLVREKQPQALLGSRIGRGMGDYETLGDMEIPPTNQEGLWETCDTTNDSWGYAWYDQNWKTPQQILQRLVSCVGRGGTYLLNVGPNGQGVVPETIANYLQESGAWVQRHPEVIYGAKPSPWGRALPWGDVTVQGNRLNLVVFDWPQDGRLFLPGLGNEIQSARLINGDEKVELTHTKQGAATQLELPERAPESLASVIELELQGAPQIDSTPAIFPNRPVTIAADQAASLHEVSLNHESWMEKYGEWKFVNRLHPWQPGSRAEWAIEVLEPGDYQITLDYKGNGRTAWTVNTSEGAEVHNQQNGTAVYQSYPLGIVHFDQPGRHTLSVSFVSGDTKATSLRSVTLTPVE